MAAVVQEIYQRGRVEDVDTAVSLLWSFTEPKLFRNKRLMRLSKEDIVTREMLMQECFELCAKNILTFHQKQVCIFISISSFVFEYFMLIMIV